MTASEADKAEVRESLRRSTLRLARREKSRPGAEMRQLYERLEPSDLVERHKWLFRPWLQFGADELAGLPDDEDAREALIAKRRAEALDELWAERGLKAVLDLARASDEAFLVGRLASAMLQGCSPEALLELVGRADLDGLPERGQMVSGALCNMSVPKRTALVRVYLTQWRDEVGRQLKLLELIPFDASIWAILNELPAPVCERFWRETKARFFSPDGDGVQRACEAFLDAGRPTMAFAQLHHGVFDRVSSATLGRVLRDVATIPTPEGDPQGPLDTYLIGEIFNALDGRDDYSLQELVWLEWVYYAHLEHGHRGFATASRLAAEDPEIVATGVARSYLPDVEKPERETVTEAERREADHWGSLLKGLNRLPGSDVHGAVDPIRLAEWLKKAAENFATSGHSESGSYVLGDWFGRLMGPRAQWLSLGASQALEPFANAKFCRGLYFGIVNSRGVHSRDRSGGSAERAIAAKYRSWSQFIAIDCPNLAGGLETVANAYEEDAAREDDRARLEREAPDLH